MASASSTSAKILFSDSKSRINQRVQHTTNGMGSLAKQILKASKSSEILSQAAKNFTQMDSVMETSELNLRKIQVQVTHLGYQYSSILTNAQCFTNVNEQAQALHNLN